MFPMETGSNSGSITYEKLQNMAYKDLQMMAKARGLPANMNRKVTVEALISYEVGDLKRVANIIQVYQMSRKRYKPQNLSISKKKRRSSTKSKNRDESIVDSTSQEVGDMSCFNCPNNTNILTNPGNVRYLDSSRADYFCGKMGMNPNNQQQQYDTEFNRSDPIDMSTDIHSSGHSVNQNNLLDYKSPSSSSSLFNNVTKFLSQNPTQYYQQGDVTSKSYAHYNNCGETYGHNLQSQLIPYNNNDLGNHHQLPSFTGNSSISVMQRSNLLANSNNYVNTCSVSQSSYYTKDSNNMPVIETDYLSYLPNIPQLTGVPTENISTSNFVSSWSQDTMLRNKPRFDKYSNEETLNLNDNVNNLLELNKTDPHKSNFLSGYGNCGESSYYIRPNNEYVNASYDYYYSRPGGQCTSTETINNGLNSAYSNHSAIYAQNDNATRTGFGLTNSSNYSIDSLVAPSQTPLPPISTLFQGMNHDYVASGYQMDTLQTPCASLNHVNCPDTTFTSYNSEHGVTFTDCGSNVNLRPNDPDCVNLVTPRSSPIASITNESILRNRLQVDPLHDLEMVPVEKQEEAEDRHSIEKDLSGNESSNISVLRVKENQFSISPASCAVVLQKSVQESKLNVNLSNTLAERNTVELEEDNSEPKTNVRQIVYESETLHRSKIICNFMKEDSLKGENVRKLIHMFGYAGLQKKKCAGLQPVTLINTLEGESKKKATTFTIIPAVRHRPCVNKGRGCTVVSQPDIVQKHEKKCFFKPVVCPSDKCTWYNAAKMLTQHILQDHEDEIENRNQFVYILDRKKVVDKTRHTYYQVHKKTIYVIHVYIEDNKCNAAIQYIPEIDSIFRPEKPSSVMMQMCAFCNKSRMKIWTGLARPYYETEQPYIDLMINVRNSEFIGLHVVIA